MAAIVRVGVLVPNDATHLDRVQRLQCALYLEFITTAERNKLLSVGGGGLTIQDLRDAYPSRVSEINAQIKGGLVDWANSATQSTKSYYHGCYDIDSVVWGRLNGWLASHTDKWIRCNHEGPNNDSLTFDSAGADITGMPSPGTVITEIADLFKLSGFVPYDTGTPHFISKR